MCVDCGSAGSHGAAMSDDAAMATPIAVPLDAERPDLPASDSECAVEVTVALIGGKWKPIVLFHLLSGPLRYSNIQRLVPRVSDRMLTRSLRELEADGLVRRTVFAEVPPRVEYELTADGRTLVPILQAMSDWGGRRGLSAVR